MIHVYIGVHACITQSLVIHLFSIYLIWNVKGSQRVHNIRKRLTDVTVNMICDPGFFCVHKILVITATFCRE